MVDPISPNQIQKKIPDFVIEVVNQLLIKHFSNGRATIKQNEIIALLELRGLNRQEIFTNHWLDIEELYQANGWKVTYDKPGYNESYEACFEFEVKSE